MPPPRVSILTPCYQQGALLEQAIASARAQTFADFEMIIVNDGSTDSTGGIAREAAGGDARFRYFEQTNQGQAAARALALENARGEFLVLLDADDLLESGMFEICLGIFDKHPETHAVVGNARIIDAEGRELRTLTQARAVPWPRVLEFNPYGALAAVMVRRDAVLGVGGLYFPAPTGAEDWDLWVRLARCGMRFEPHDAILARYRQSPGSFSRRLLPMLDSQLAVLEFARGDDSRLAGARNPAPPIPATEYARLVNGRVFHTLGLAAFESPSVPQIHEIAARFAAGGMDSTYCREQFLWGCQQSFERHDKDPALLASDDYQRTCVSMVEVVGKRLCDLGLTRESRDAETAMKSILSNPFQQAPLVRRISRRLRHLF